MNSLTFSDGTKKFIRVSKPTARKAFYQGLKIALCPVRFNPCGFYYKAFETSKNEDNNDFNKLVNAFEYYNCQYAETGKYTAFYLVQEH